MNETQMYSGFQVQTALGGFLEKRKRSDRPTDQRLVWKTICNERNNYSIANLKCHFII